MLKRENEEKREYQEEERVYHMLTEATEGKKAEDSGGHTYEVINETNFTMIGKVTGSTTYHHGEVLLKH